MLLPMALIVLKLLDIESLRDSLFPPTFKLLRPMYSLRLVAYMLLSTSDISANPLRVTSLLICTSCFSGVLLTYPKIFSFVKSPKRMVNLFSAA